ncbi:MAG: hypothetical protein JNJ71_08640 [Rubrivivax sp.]|nr:hypothetical protein [Rubrivivax sp.]
MSFWSGERLSQEIQAKNLIFPFDQSCIDCASYRLAVGDQVFATADLLSGRPTEPVIGVLRDPPDHTLKILPGQFAFLLTKENVTVPSNAMALISMRAGYKLRGLINVSGFHVDPGWSGHLVFSVYNAGPAPIIVERGEPMFLIVFADLDQDSKKIYSGKSKGQKTLKLDLVQGMALQVFSPLMLQRSMKELEERLGTVSGALATVRSVTYAVTAVATLGLAVAAIWATYHPSTVGLMLGSLVQQGGYELRLKQTESSAIADPKRATTAPERNDPPTGASAPGSANANTTK